MEWQGSEVPAIFEITPKYDTNASTLPEEESELAKAFALLK